MIVVADAGPIQYLVRLGAVDVLAALYQRVLVPQSVAQELQQNKTPMAARPSRRSYPRLSRPRRTGRHSSRPRCPRGSLIDG